MKESKSKKGNILVPVDFSPHSEAALLLACKLAECFGAVPLVLHVVHDPGETPGYYLQAMKKKQLHRIEDSAREMLDEFLARVAKNHGEARELTEVESILVRGLPSNRILEIAKKRKASMIVMGSKGCTGIKHLLLGSVAERVVQFAPVPVTVAK